MDAPQGSSGKVTLVVVLAFQDRLPVKNSVESPVLDLTAMPSDSTEGGCVSFTWNCSGKLHASCMPRRDEDLETVEAAMAREGRDTRRRIKKHGHTQRESSLSNVSMACFEVTRASHED